MNTNNYKCIRCPRSDKDILTLGKVYTITLRTGSFVPTIYFEGDNKQGQTWASEHLEQFELVPEVTSPKVKGFIFKVAGDNTYYLNYQDGITVNKKDAYIYTADEILDLQLSDGGWGTKVHGKWLVVYE